LLDLQRRRPQIDLQLREVDGSLGLQVRGRQLRENRRGIVGRDARLDERAGEE